MDAFFGLEKYYFETYSVSIDAACKNTNRLRFFSWDPEIIHVKGEKFTTYVKKEPKKVMPSVIVVKNDFDEMINQATAAGVLIVDGYEKWLAVGFALASEFGESGRHYFHTLSSAGYDYDAKKCDKQYNKCIAANGNGITINSLFYYCKEAGVEIYREETKATISIASQYKRSGKNREDAIRLLEEVKGIEVDTEIVNKVFDSKENFDKGLSDDGEMAQLEAFVMDNYQPEYNELSKNIEVYNRSEVLTDRVSSQMYIDSCKSLAFNIKAQDIQAILTGSTPVYNPIKNFFSANAWDGKEGRIAEYIDCVHARNDEEKDRNKYFFKKWFVGMIHNWTCSEYDKTVSPLTLVLAGQAHGKGKTSFFRNLIPEELIPYYTEAKLDHKDKDSLFLMANNLVVMDDEFGGKAFKEDKAFKALSDKTFISLRRPYGRVTETFKRRAMLCGTTNEVDILKDATGNRRLIPVHFSGVDYENMLNVDTVQMFLEGMELYRSGFDWQLRSTEDQELLSSSSEAFKQDSIAVDLLLNAFELERTPYATQRVVMNTGELSVFLASAFPRLSIKGYELQAALVELGIDMKKVRKIDGKVENGADCFL